MQTSRDGVNRRQRNQERLSSAVPSVFILSLQLFAIWRETCSGYFLTSAIETAVFNGPLERPRGTLMDSDTLSSPSVCAVSECWECAAVEQDERAPEWHSSITDAPLALNDCGCDCNVCVKEMLLLQRNQMNSQILSTIFQL